MRHQVVLAVIALSMCAALPPGSGGGGEAAAAIVHFVNPAPGEPGHHAWQLDILGPPSWLDITLSPHAQTNAPSPNSVAQLAGSFGNLHGPDPGSPGQHALVLANLGPIPFTAALLYGDPVQADATSDFFASTAHTGGGDLTNFPEGEHRYIGVLTMAGNFGWIEVVRHDMSLTAIAWAYETQPGVVIHAGQIPAPGVLAVLALGAMAGRRRVRRRDSD